MKEFVGRRGLDIRLTAMFVEKKVSPTNMLAKLERIFLTVVQIMSTMWKRKEQRTPLWKHILEKHNGVMAIPIFSHFKMKLIQFFSKPQRRKANEGVRISHLDPDIRMNSKDEFLQGCNIFMQPVRGVGM